jgi:hypothetical protein
VDISDLALCFDHRRDCVPDALSALPADAIGR